ncbi:hypothetical protein JCM8097_007966 [Rhodosporidiobolus ruineniae]
MTVVEGSKLTFKWKIGGIDELLKKAGREDVRILPRQEPEYAGLWLTAVPTTDEVGSYTRSRGNFYFSFQLSSPEGIKLASEPEKTPDDYNGVILHGEIEPVALSNIKPPCVSFDYRQLMQKLFNNPGLSDVGFFFDPSSGAPGSYILASKFVLSERSTYWRDIFSSASSATRIEVQLATSPPKPLNKLQGDLHEFRDFEDFLSTEKDATAPPALTFAAPAPTAPGPGSSVAPYKVTIVVEPSGENGQPPPPNAVKNRFNPISAMKEYEKYSFEASLLKGASLAYFSRSLLTSVTSLRAAQLSTSRQAFPPAALERRQCRLSPFSVSVSRSGGFFDSPAFSPGGNGGAFDTSSPSFAVPPPVTPPTTAPRSVELVAPLQAASSVAGDHVATSAPAAASGKLLGTKEMSTSTTSLFPLTAAGCSYSTLYSLLLFLHGGKVSFLPLASNYLVAFQQENSIPFLRSYSTSARDTWLEKNAQQKDPPACSAHAFYRLAALWKVDDAMERAKRYILSELTVENVGYEVFSKLSFDFEEIQEVLVQFIVENWNEVTSRQAWKQALRLLKEEKLAGGEDIPVTVLERAVAKKL